MGTPSSRARLSRGVKGGISIHIAPAGVCWSNKDVVDVIAPTIPRILKVEKQPLQLANFENIRFNVKRVESGFTVRLSLRMESSGWWKGLRAADECALTPDEHAIAVFLLSRSKGESRVLTDFPSERCEVKRIGMKQYYDSQLDVSEVALCLLSSSVKSHRNAYVHKAGMMSVEVYRPPAVGGLVDLFSGLGDWYGYYAKKPH